MKLRTLILVCLAWPGIALADEIDWYTIDGGGGSTAEGGYTLEGTIGQPDTGLYIPYCCPLSIFGGYWSQFIDVNQPDGPRLCIKLTGTNTVLVSWPAYHTGYLLQKKIEPGPGWPALWGDVPNPVISVLDGENCVFLDDLVGWMTAVYNNAGNFETNYFVKTGEESYLWCLAPPLNWSYVSFNPTNDPTFFRLQK